MKIKTIRFHIKHSRTSVSYTHLDVYKRQANYQDCILSASLQRLLICHLPHIEKRGFGDFYDLIPIQSVGMIGRLVIIRMPVRMIPDDRNTYFGKRTVITSSYRIFPGAVIRFQLQTVFSDILFQPIPKDRMGGLSLIHIYLDYFRGEDTTNPLGANLGGYYPRPLENDRNRNPQTRYLQNAAYCRLKNVTLGYTLPKSLTEKFCVNNCLLYTSSGIGGTLSSKSAYVHLLPLSSPLHTIPTCSARAIKRVIR